MQNDYEPKYYYCQAPGPGPGPFMVLAWSYPGLAPFLVKTGPGVDTIIKQSTSPSTSSSPLMEKPTW